MSALARARGSRLAEIPAAVLLALAPLTGSAAPPARLAAPGPIVDAWGQEGELVALDADVVARLASLPFETAVEVEDWPVAPGSRGSVTLTRRPVFTQGARLVKVEGDREVELPPPRLVFLSGTATADPSRPVFASIDPETGAVRGWADGPDGLFEIAPAAGTSRHLVAPGWARARAAGVETWTCGEEELPPTAAAAAPRSALSAPGPALASLHTAVVAVDTDNELMQLKFANDTAAALSYVASLFASIGVMYERDLNVRPLVGTVILRVSSTADPYTGGGGNADGSKLGEFGSNWSAHYAGVRRALTVMLSGKQSSTSSASGIAWVGGLCSSGTGYSFSQVFKVDYLTGDTQLVGHEMGHNLGSPHTHCYSPPLDTCYNGESCYTGSTSCPAPATMSGISNVKGTLMSYCHLLGGCSVTNVFHPGTVSYVSGTLQGAVGACLFPVGAAAPAVTSVSRATGPVSGGTALSVAGANFQAGAAVAFVDASGAVLAAPVTYVGAARLDVTTPAHAAGDVDVVVMNPDQQTATLRRGFTYLPPPAVLAIVPNSGLTNASTPVRITGSGFSSGMSVTIGGLDASPVAVLDAGTLTAAAPPHATGPVDVVVNLGPQTARLASAFFYAPPPAAAALRTLTPCRLVDTRTTDGPALAASEKRVFTATGKCGVPPTARSLCVNLSVVQPAAPGYFGAYPGNAFPLGSSVLNFAPGQVRTNNAVLGLATDGSGSLGLFNGSNGSTHAVIDVTGYFE